jgi:hypothetical protein
MSPSTEDKEAAEALVQVIGATPWEAVTFAHGFLAMLGGTSLDGAAREMYDRGPQTLKKSKELLAEAATKGFVALLTPRQKTGSAENPITKLFPAVVTEQRFLEMLDDLHAVRPSVTYTDERGKRSLIDFTLREGEQDLPINIKNAGTPFRKAAELVGLASEDCIPIPAYKAYLALESAPNLLYAVSVDYALIDVLDALLPTLFDAREAVVWKLLNGFKGAKAEDAEDAFVTGVVRKHWSRVKAGIAANPFHVISARKAIRVLQIKPKRTPGLGLRGWGTGAAGEVNVHLSIQEDTTPWGTVSGRIVSAGLTNIVEAVNRRRMEEVYDPEI